MEIVEQEIYYNGSSEYKTYMQAYKKNPDISFHYSGSQKLNSSMDLLKVNIGNVTFFKEFLDWAQQQNNTNTQ